MVAEAMHRMKTHCVPLQCISHMDFVRTTVGYRRKAGTHTLVTVSRIVFNFYGKTRSETYQLTAFYQLC